MCLHTPSRIYVSVHSIDRAVSRADAGGECSRMQVASCIKLPSKPGSRTDMRNDELQRFLRDKADLYEYELTTSYDLSPTCVHVHVVLMLGSCQLCFTSQLDCSRPSLRQVQQKADSA